MPTETPETVWPEEAVEKLAEYMCACAYHQPPWQLLSDELRGSWRRDARKALDALSEHLVPAAALEEVRRERDENEEQIDNFDSLRAEAERRAEQAETRLAEVEGWNRENRREAQKAWEKLREVRAEIGKLGESASSRAEQGGTAEEPELFCRGKVLAYRHVAKLLDSDPPQPQQLRSFCCGREVRPGWRHAPDCPNAQPQHQEPRCGGSGEVTITETGREPDGTPYPYPALARCPGCRDCQPQQVEQGEVWTIYSPTGDGVGGYVAEHGDYRADHPGAILTRYIPEPPHPSQEVTELVAEFTERATEENLTEAQRAVWEHAALRVREKLSATAPPEVTEEEVEAAARAVYGVVWDELPNEDKNSVRFNTRTALQAARRVSRGSKVGEEADRR